MNQTTVEPRNYRPFVPNEIRSLIEKGAYFRAANFSAPSVGKPVLASLFFETESIELNNRTPGGEASLRQISLQAASSEIQFN